MPKIVCYSYKISPCFCHIDCQARFNLSSSGEFRFRPCVRSAALSGGHESQQQQQQQAQCGPAGSDDRASSSATRDNVLGEADTTVGRPLFPRVLALDRWRRRELRAKERAAIATALNCSGSGHVQEVLLAAALAEGVYKVVDHGREEAAVKVANLVRDVLPPQLAGGSPLQLQWSLPHVRQLYLVAESEDAVFLSIMGTKMRRDLATNANAILVKMWDDDETKTRDLSSAPAAHRGFWQRAQAVPIESVFEVACSKRKRLVVTGHSLGGAVAVLCTLRLLRQLPPGRADVPISCIAFATPSIGNGALAELVAGRGWHRYISNLLLPEDVIVQLTSPSQYRRATGGNGGRDSVAPPPSQDRVAPQPREGGQIPQLDAARVLNPSVRMIATAATLTALATVAGMAPSAAALASTAAVAARARWSNGSGSSRLGGVSSERSAKRRHQDNDSRRSGATREEALIKPSNTALEPTRSATALADAALSDTTGNLGGPEAPATALKRQSDSINTNSASVDVAALKQQQPGLIPAPSFNAKTLNPIPQQLDSGRGSIKLPLGWLTGGISGSPPLSDSPTGLPEIFPDTASKGTPRNSAAVSQAVPRSPLQAASGSSPEAASGSSPEAATPTPATAALVDPPGGSAGGGGCSNSGRISGTSRGGEGDLSPPQPKPLQPKSQGSGWHWDPPDPGRAAKWAGSRAAQFATPAVRGAAHLVSLPLRKALSAARAYVAIPGTQVYVLPNRCTSNPQDLASREAAQPVAANSGPAGDGALRDSSADFPAADVTGAAAALDATEAEQLSAMEGVASESRAWREFFVMHRMAQYRGRLRVIWQTAVGAQRVAAWQEEFPPHRAVLSDGLCPRFTQLQAEAVMPPADDLAQSSRVVTSMWPLGWLSGGTGLTVPRPEALHLQITIVGRGLQHCTGAKVIVAPKGVACQTVIVRQPQSTFNTLSDMSNASQLEYICQLASDILDGFAKLQHAANSFIRQRPGRALLDAMTLSVTVPASSALAVRQSVKLSDSSRTGASQASPGQLLVQLQSDWQTETILVRLEVSEVGAVLQRVLHCNEGATGQGTAGAAPQ